MYKILMAIFKVYGIEEILVKEEDNLEIIILKRNKSLTMNQWIDLVTTLKYKSQKEINFLLESQALKIYGNTNKFTHIGVMDYE